MFVSEYIVLRMGVAQNTMALSTAGLVNTRVVFVFRHGKHIF